MGRVHILVGVLLAAASPLLGQDSPLPETLDAHGEGVACVAFSPDGKTLASGDIDESIKLWNVAASKNIASLTGHADSVNSVAFGTPQDSGVGKRGQDHPALGPGHRHDHRTLKGHTDSVSSVAFSPNGNG